MQNVQQALFEYDFQSIWHDWLDKLWKDYLNGEYRYINEPDRKKAAKIIEQFTVQDNKNLQIIELCEHFEFPTVANFLKEWKEEIYLIKLEAPSEYIDEGFDLKSYPQMIESRVYTYHNINDDLQAKIIFGNYQGYYLLIEWGEEW